MTFAWATLPAPRPVGALTVVVSETGLAAVAFGVTRTLAEAAAARAGEALVADPARTAEAVAQLGEYLAGRRRVFDLPLDWGLTSAGSQRRVLQTLYAEVGYGETISYGRLAVRSGLGSEHTAARRVGAIMGSNPLPVVVPCHRVTAADGLGGFGGGRAVKEWLLALEGVMTPALDFDG